MKVEKKGVRAQVSAFIIIAVLIVAVAGIFFILKKDVLDLRLGVNPEVKPVYSFVESCIKETAEDAVYYIGDTGGYFTAPELSTENKVAYYFNGENHMPSREQIEEELSIYIDEMLFFCTKNFVYFLDFNVNQEEIKSQSKIEDNKVIFNVKYPLSVSKDEKTYFFEDFNVEIPVRLGVIYNAVYELMQEQIKTPKDICVTCIEELTFENNLQIALYDYDDAVIFSVIDIESEINGKVYEFYFANKYE